MKHAFKFAAMVLAGLGAFCLGGCVHFHDQPLAAEKTGADFSARTLSDAGLKAYLEANHVSGEWPRAAWDFNGLTLAAFYYQPSLDVARAQWAVATAGKTTAGERPNPTLSVSPADNTTTTAPSPWIVTPSLDIPIETAGKRGYRVAQATQLSEVARLNIASVAWQVRSAVRRSLVNLDAARAMEVLLREQQKIQTENLRLLGQQLQAGAISPFELTQARVAADSTRLALHDAERQRAEARVQLAQAIGVPTHALDGVEFSFDSLRVMPAEVATAEARRQALSNRADILSALAEYAASQAALQLGIAKQYPDIRLSPGYEYDQGDNKWSLGISVTLPVFNHNQGAIAEAQARRTEAAAKFNALQAGVLAEIDLAVAGYRAAMQKQADADAMLANLQSQEKAARARLDAGDISKIELAALQLQFSTGAVARQEALTQARQAKGQLEDALQSPAELMPSAERSPRSEQTTALLNLRQTISLPHVKGGFDLMAVDLAGKRLFLSAEDNNTTEVIDLAAGKFAHTIIDVIEPKWVVHRPELHRLFIRCEPGKLVVLDATNGKEVAALDIAPEPDGVHNDPKRRLIYISCGDGSLDVVRQTDADHYEFAGRIPTAQGAATSLFVPELNQLFLAVPQRDGQTAELRVYSAIPK